MLKKSKERKVTKVQLDTVSIMRKEEERHANNKDKRIQNTHTKGRVRKNNNDAKRTNTGRKEKTQPGQTCEL